MAKRLIPAHMRYVDSAGDPLSGGKLYFYKRDTSDAKDTFSDDAGTSANTNPLILDTQGRPQVDVWGIGDYKMVLTSATGTPASPIATYNPLVESPDTDDVVSSLTELEAIDASTFEDGVLVRVAGNIPQDGLFYWDSLSNETSNDGTIVGTGPGQWHRMYDGRIRVSFFGAAPGLAAATNRAAIQAAIDYAEAIGGAVVSFVKGTYDVDATLTIDADNVVLEGEGRGTIIKYTGASQTDYLIYGGSSATEGWGVRNIRLQGGEFRLGKTKWVFYAEAFQRGCVLDNVLMRESLGILNLQTCYYAEINNVECQSSVPDPADQGWSLSDWQDVYASGSAPIYFGGNGGGMRVSRMTIGTVGSETHTGNTGDTIVLFDAASGTITDMTFESCGVDFDTYTPQTTNAITVLNSQVTFRKLHCENWGAVSRGIYSKGRSQTILDHPFLYYFQGGASSMLLCNDATFDFVTHSLYAYRTHAKRFARVESQNGGSNQDFVFNNPVVATGERYTDSGVSAFFENLYDTYGSVNLLGLEESNFPQANPRDSLFPEINNGFSVTNSSDGNGHYVEVTAGNFMNDRGRMVSNKLPTQNSATDNVVYRLRPTNASKYYRLYVGYAGNMYLTESSGAFSSDRGNWIAQFQTNGSSEITNLSTNPRLSYRGKYIDGQAIFKADSTPTSGNWAIGDTLYYKTPITTGFIGEVCTVGGSPGTWKTFGVIS